MLLAEDGKHLRAGLLADEGALGHLREQCGVIPRGSGAEVVVAVKVEGVVEHGVREPQFPDAPIDGIQPQMIDDHVGGDVVRADDHHGSGILDLELCAHAQRPQHSGAVNELALLVGDLFLKAGLAPADLEVERRQNKGLDGGGRLKFFVRTDLNGVPL